MTSNSPALTVLIAENDPAHLQLLRIQVKELKPNWSVVCCTGSIEEVIRGVEEHLPHIVLLDMQLTNNGHQDWLHRLPEELALICIANDRQSALDAFDYDAIDVLVKPYTMSRAQKALDRAEWRLARPSLEQGQANWRHASAHSASASLGWIKMSRGQELILVEPSDVIYMIADCKYTRLVTNKGEGLVRVGLATMLEHLDAKKFVRVNRSAAVNLSYVYSVRKNDLGHMDVVLNQRTERLRVSKAAGSVFRCGI